MDGSSQPSGAPALDDSPNRERLNGNTARRRHRGAERVIWDTELPGFGLRCYPSGAKRWIVRYVERGRARVWTISETGEVDAARARRAARKLLQDAVLHGLPRKPAKPARSSAPTFEAVCAVFLKDRPFAWVESTERRARLDIAQVLIPDFGNIAIDGLSRADVLRWRDGMVTRPGRYHVAVATLGAILKYAEKLGHRTIGSDPTRGVPRYKQQPKQRFLDRAEYARLEHRLSELNDWRIATAIRLLVHTGARCSEIGTLRWKDVNGQRLELPRSKTGRKTILLSDHARALIDGMSEGAPEDYLFAEAGEGPPNLSQFWQRWRSTAGLPHVRLHDLRHSYVSIAVQNGFDLEAVGRLLGHMLPDTTRRYAHLDDGCIVEAAETVGSSIAAMLGLTR